MKKNKTVAFMLAASLMVGGTFLGTKAWFTGEASASNDLVVTMGNLGITVEESGWSAKYDGTEANQVHSVSGNIFTNAKPGDVFEKTIKITNIGSLNRKISIGKQLNAFQLPEGITMDDEELLALDGKVMAGSDQIDDITLKFTINESVGGEYKADGSLNKEELPSWDFGELIGSYQIVASQTDEEPNYNNPAEE